MCLACREYVHLITTYIAPEDGYKPVYFSLSPPFDVIIESFSGQEYLEGGWFMERGHWWYKVRNNGSEELIITLLGKRDSIGVF